MTNMKSYTKFLNENSWKRNPEEVLQSLSNLIPNFMEASDRTVDREFKSLRDFVARNFDIGLDNVSILTKKEDQFKSDLEDTLYENLDNYSDDVKSADKKTIEKTLKAFQQMFKKYS